MRTLAAKMLAVLRVVYVVFAMLLGVGFAVASVALLSQGIDAAMAFAQCNSTVEPSSVPGGEIVKNCYGLDGPDPLSFDSYGKGPVLAAMFFLTAFGAFKRRWEMSRLPWLFLISFVMVPATVGVLYDVGRSQLGFGTIARLVIPISGIVVASRLQSHLRTSPAQAALAAIAIASYAWRAIITVTGPEAAQAIDTLRGGDTLYVESIELVSGSIVGLGAATALLVTAVLSLWGRMRALSAALAFTAGLSFPGFLQALDLVLGLQEGGYVAYVIQEAVAFVACATALALTLAPPRGTATSATPSRRG